MAMNFDNVDAGDFGYAFDDGIEEAGLVQAKQQLEAAKDRAQRDVQMRQVVLRQSGQSYFLSDDAWQRLTAKAHRMDDLRYAVVQKIHMVRAKAEAQDPTGPRLYGVTQGECQQKKDAYRQALADHVEAKKNSLDFGPNLPEVQEHVNYLAKQTGIRWAEYRLASKKLAYDEKRHAVATAFDTLMATARRLCMARTEGDRQCLGVQLNLRRKDFEPLAVAYNTAAKEVNGAIESLATVRRHPSGPTASAASSSSSSAATFSSAVAAASRTAARSTTATVYGQDNNQLEAVPRFRSSGLPTADLRQSTSSARQDFEALLATTYGSSQASAAVTQGVSASRLTTTTRTATQRIGPWIVTETSVVQVHQQIQAVRLNQLTTSWELAFGAARAEGQQMALAECIDSGDHDGNEESIVLHACLVRPEVTAVHIRLLLRYLGYPIVAWVKRGHSYRRGPREDCAWIKFRSLDEARDCKWRWDGMGHWGLTAWDEWNNIPRPLHFSFSTHPDYAGLKQ